MMVMMVNMVVCVPLYRSPMTQGKPRGSSSRNSQQQPHHRISLSLPNRNLTKSSCLTHHLSHNRAYTMQAPHSSKLAPLWHSMQLLIQS